MTASKNGVTTMTSNRLAYKNYTASVEFSSEDMLLVGRIEDIDSLIVFSAEDAKALEVEFKAAVDAYLAHCAELNVTPERPCKGSFNIRIGQDLHRQSATAAKTQNISLNEYVKRAVAAYVRREAVDIAHAHAVYSEIREINTRPSWDVGPATSDSNNVVSLAKRRAFN